MLLLLLNNSLLLFSQHCHIGDVIINSDGSKGVVFYLNPDRLGGWMVALNDQSTGCKWGTNTDIPELTNYAAQNADPLLMELDGKENTRIIRAYQQNNATYAAGKVDVAHGWYLPSIGQLRILFGNLALIEPALVANGGSVLSNGKYWSSTEQDATMAKTLSADQGAGFHSMLGKTSNASVRAIRDFSFFEWSDGSNTDHIVVAPTETTTYTVMVQTGVCGMAEASIEVTVNHPGEVTFEEDACEHYTWHGTDYTESGTYTYETETTAGCERIETLELTIHHGTHNAETAAACDSYTWHGTNYTTSGNYIYPYTNSNGCPSADTLHLTIYPSKTSVQTETACESFTWVNGITYYESTSTPTCTFETAQGCDSLVTLHLTVLHGTHNAETVNACDSYTWHGTNYTSSGNYIYLYTNSNGCPSADTLHLTIYPSKTSVQTETACESFTWVNGITYYESTSTPTCTFETAQGCDSLVTLHLTVLHGTHNADTVNACDSYTWHGTTYTSSGNYIYPYTNANGCPSADTLHLTINTLVTSVQEETTCEPFTWVNGITYYESTSTPTFTFQTEQGCDSIVTLHLTVLHGTHNAETVNACDSYPWHGTNYTSSGNYIYTYFNADGCPSADTLHLTVHPSKTSVQEETTCEPFTWVNGITYYESTSTPTFTFQTAQGCDSIVTLHLTVEPVLQGDTTVVVGVPFVWYGQTYPESGDYPHTFPGGSYLGCDSTTVLHLTVLPVLPGDTLVVTCEPFEWYGQTYPESGDYSHTFPNGSYLECDSVVVLHLTVLPVLPGDTVVVTCVPFEWYGQTYPMSGDYPHTFPGASELGCDSTAVLHLTVIPPLEGDTIALACEPFEWYGQNYPMSGDYPYTLTDASYLGCDSTVVLHLTIEPVSQGDTTVIVGLPFEWYGQTYSVSGDYPHTFLGGSYLGCDSTVVLHLTVLPSLPGDTIALVCEPFEWYGQTCPVTGDYSHTFPNGSSLGNDSIVVLHLTVLPVLDGDTTALVCEPFEWYGQTYPVSGDYPYTLIDASYLGCDSTVVLHLTVEPVLQGDTTAVVGVPFVWYGQTYPESGDYPHTFLDGSYLGCDSIVVLHLTVLPSLPGDTTALVCEPFAWYGETYSVSGDYPHTFPGEGYLGSDSIVVLHLTVEPVLQGDTTAVVDAPFEWYGQTYSQSGDYPHLFPGGSYLGCDSTVVLHLTVSSLALGDTIALVCEPFEWYGQTYSESGDYTHVFPDGSWLGGDSTLVLHLTVQPVRQGDTTVVVPHPFAWYGEIYRVSGNYPHTFPGGSYLGCDSTVVLHLIVLPTPVGDTTAYSCGPFVWHGVTYPESGHYSHTFHGGGYLGSDSTAVLHLTVEQLLADTVVASACASLEWQGQLLTQSGYYTDTVVTQQGCDSILVLDLTIYDPELEIMGYQDVFYASDIWHGIYHYYVVDSSYSYIDSVEWQCTNPSWHVLPLSDFHCVLIVTSMGTGILTARPSNLLGCDGLLFLEIRATEFNDHTDDTIPILVYPNPADEEVTVVAPNLVSVRVFNVLGQPLRTVPPEHNDSTTFPIEGLPGGLYVLEITTSNGVYLKRVIVWK